MAFTLSNLLQNIYGDLGQTETFLATGGGTTSAIDTVKSGLDSPPDDNYCKEGTLFVVRDSGGASAAPEGEYSRISAYDSATQTYTVSVTAAIASGDTIMVATSLFPLNEMIRVCNRTLQALGRIRLWDESLTMAAGQHEYTLPIATKGYPFKVFVQTRDDSDDHDWEAYSGWRVKPATSGSTETLVLNEVTDGYLIGIEYEGVHPTLSVYSSVVNEYLDPEYVTSAATVEAMKWYLSASGGGSDFWQQRYNMAQSALDEAKKMRRKVYTQQPKYLVYTR